MDGRAHRRRDLDPDARAGRQARRAARRRAARHRLPLRCAERLRRRPPGLRGVRRGQPGWGHGGVGCRRPADRAGGRAGAVSIRVGTCSWADESLSALWYPSDVRSAEARLRYYADRFTTVEVNSSYYAMPVAETAETWAQRTPDAF